MTITIEIPSEVEKTIMQAASRAETTVEEYALQTLLRQARKDCAMKPKEVLSYEEWERRLTALGERHAPLPQPIPLEALRRENIYEE